jgi:formamidopyrimidine-DNA glycosylase
MSADSPPFAHDHVDLMLDSGRCLRFNDPRRFGCLLFTTKEPSRHRLLSRLAAEPLSDEFDADALWKLARGRTASIKSFIMDSRAVVGIGNIYASEALFRAGIRPGLAAGRVSRERIAALVEAIRHVLNDAIAVGGTTLRDYVDPAGAPGYFGPRLLVYERRGKPCRRCRTPIRQFTQGSRSTYWCPRCQR